MPVSPSCPEVTTVVVSPSCATASTRTLVSASFSPGATVASSARAQVSNGFRVMLPPPLSLTTTSLSEGLRRNTSVPAGPRRAPASWASGDEILVLGRSVRPIGEDVGKTLRHLVGTLHPVVDWPQVARLADGRAVVVAGRAARIVPSLEVAAAVQHVVVLAGSAVRAMIGPVVRFRCSLTRLVAPRGP